MANLHSRSNSLPSKPHPLMDDVHYHLHRLKASEGMPTSAASLCSILAALQNCHEAIQNLIQLPSTQQALIYSRGEMLKRSLELVDLCGISRDIVCLTKESVQALESSLRRNQGKTIAEDDIDAYTSLRKKISKMANKCIKNLKHFNRRSTALPDDDNDLKPIVTLLKEIEALSFSALKSIIVLLSGVERRSKQRSWPLLSLLTQPVRVHDDKEHENDFFDPDFKVLQKGINKNATQNVLKQLKSSETTMQDLEEGLESFFRCLFRTRVSLLNALNK